MESISSRTRSEILISQDDFSSAATIEAAPTFEVIDKYILSNFQDSSERSLIDFYLIKAKAEKILKSKIQLKCPRSRRSKSKYSRQL